MNESQNQNIHYDAFIRLIELIIKNKQAIQDQDLSILAHFLSKFQYIRETINSGQVEFAKELLKISNISSFKKGQTVKKIDEFNEDKTVIVIQGSGIIFQKKSDEQIDQELYWKDRYEMAQRNKNNIKIKQVQDVLNYYSKEETTDSIELKKRNRYLQNEISEVPLFRYVCQIQSEEELESTLKKNRKEGMISNCILISNSDKFYALIVNRQLIKTIKQSFQKKHLFLQNTFRYQLGIELSQEQLNSSILFQRYCYDKMEQKQLIYCDNNQKNLIYFIEDGLVDIYKGEFKIATYKPGQIFGFECLFNDNDANCMLLRSQSQKQQQQLSSFLEKEENYKAIAVSKEIKLYVLKASEIDKVSYSAPIALYQLAKQAQLEYNRVIYQQQLSQRILLQEKLEQQQQQEESCFESTVTSHFLRSRHSNTTQYFNQRSREGSNNSQIKKLSIDKKEKSKSPISKNSCLSLLKPEEVIGSIFSNKNNNGNRDSSIKQIKIKPNHSRILSQPDFNFPQKQQYLETQQLKYSLKKQCSKRDSQNNYSPTRGEGNSYQNIQKHILKTEKQEFKNVNKSRMDFINTSSYQGNQLRNYQLAEDIQINHGIPLKISSDQQEQSTLPISMHQKFEMYSKQNNSLSKMTNNYFESMKDNSDYLNQNSNATSNKQKGKYYLQQSLKNKQTPTQILRNFRNLSQQSAGEEEDQEEESEEQTRKESLDLSTSIHKQNVSTFQLKNQSFNKNQSATIIYPHYRLLPSGKIQSFNEIENVRSNSCSNCNESMNNTSSSYQQQQQQYHLETNKQQLKGAVEQLINKLKQSGNKLIKNEHNNKTSFLQIKNSSPPKGILILSDKQIRHQSQGSNSNINTKFLLKE